jgi:hypothetical protein
MCLSAEALALFLNIIGTDLVSTDAGRIVVHATDGDVTYVANGDAWCTMAPQIDRMTRIEALRNE